MSATIDELAGRVVALVPEQAGLSAARIDVAMRVREDLHVEDSFGITIADEEVGARVRSVGDLIDLVAAKTGPASDAGAPTAPGGRR